MTLVNAILTLKVNSQRSKGADFSRYGDTASKVGFSGCSQNLLEQLSHLSW